MTPFTIRFRKLLLVASIIAGFIPTAQAQEAVAKSPYGHKNEVRTEGLELTSTISRTYVQTGLACGSRAAGTQWSVGCGTNFSGSRTMACIQGKEVVVGSTCESTRPCGSQAHAARWNTSCPVGNRPDTAQMGCFDGSSAYTSLNNCRNWYNCGGHPHGSSWTRSTSCGVDKDGETITGTVGQRCYDGSTSTTYNTCHGGGGGNPTPQPQSCGGRAHGSQWEEACTGGSRTLMCNNGGVQVIRDGCRTVLPTPCGIHPHGSSWTEACGGGQKTLTCDNGTTRTVNETCSAAPQACTGKLDVGYVYGTECRESSGNVFCAHKYNAPYIVSRRITKCILHEGQGQSSMNTIPSAIFTCELTFRGVMSNGQCVAQ